MSTIAATVASSSTVRAAAVQVAVLPLRNPGASRGADDEGVLKPKSAIFASVTAALAMVAANDPVPLPVTSPVSEIV